MKRIFTPHLQSNSGESRPLTVRAPEGSIFNPVAPAPCFIGAWTSLRLSDMIVQALAPALPDVIPAENAGDLDASWLAYLRDPKTGKPWIWTDCGGIGHGATSTADGMTALTHPIEAGVEFGPTEVAEARVPLLVRRFELIPNSGGPGKFRGGLGAMKEFEFLTEGEGVSHVEKSFHSTVRGLAGGRPAPELNQAIWFEGTDREMRLGKRSGIEIRPGDTVMSRPAGGGGWGNPLERDPERVIHDVREGYITLEAALDDYGVVIDGDTGEVDTERTKELRTRRMQRG
jgi:N-methylhydantoinase B